MDTFTYVSNAFMENLPLLIIQLGVHSRALLQLRRVAEKSPCLYLSIHVLKVLQTFPNRETFYIL